MEKQNNTPLEFSMRKFHQYMSSVTSMLHDYYEQLDHRKIDLSDTGFLLAKQQGKERKPPLQGRSFKSVTDELLEAALYSQETRSRGYLAYMASGGLFESALADFITKCLNPFISTNSHAPLFAKMESDVLRWLGSFIGYPDESSGVLTTGGSSANLNAVVMARTCLLGDQFGKGVIYLSEQTHYSILKAAHCAGFNRQQLRILPTNSRFQMDLTALMDCIVEDNKKGLKPFMVVGTAGSTNLGVVDDLSEISEICRRNKLWFHIDAAYGGFYSMTERGKVLLEGIQNGDSVTLDPHKGLFLPFGTGALMVKKGKLLQQVFQHDASYLAESYEDDIMWNFSDMSTELTREMRGLRIWLPLNLHGQEVFKEALENTLDLARLLSQRLHQKAGWKTLVKPWLSTVTFCYDSGEGTQLNNRINQAIVEKVNRKNRFHIGTTTVNGMKVIRVCFLSYRTKEEQVEMLIEDLEQAKEESRHELEVFCE